MKFIDVTFRDGGHQHNFNWPLEFVKRYLDSINSFGEIEFVELGYWKQSGKFDGPFYSIEEKLLKSMCQMTKKKLQLWWTSIIVLITLKIFQEIDFKELGLIRVCFSKRGCNRGMQIL